MTQNITITPPSSTFSSFSSTSMSDADVADIVGKLHSTIGAAFFGFVVGAILYGITLRQTYQYYTTANDKWVRKSIIALVVLMDTLHLVFSMYMVYALILQKLGLESYAKDVLWSLKALGSTQTLFIVFVQGYYLWQIWLFANNGNILLSSAFKLAVQIFVGFISLFALGIAVVFMIQLQKLESILSLAPGFEYVVYLGFGATALVDCAIATAMCLVLYRSSGGGDRDSDGEGRWAERSESVIESLIKYFIATGLLTSFAAIMCIVLYVAEPHTLLYLGMEFSVTRLYANSVLAMFNGRQSLRDRMNQPLEIEMPSGLLFGGQSLAFAGSGSPSFVDRTFAGGGGKSFGGGKRGSMMKFKGMKSFKLGSGEYAKLTSPEEGGFGGGIGGADETSPNGMISGRSMRSNKSGRSGRSGRSLSISPSPSASPGATSPNFNTRLLDLPHSPSRTPIYMLGEERYGDDNGRYGGERYGEERYGNGGYGNGGYGDADIGIEVEVYEEKFGGEKKGEKGEGEGGIEEVRRGRGEIRDEKVQTLRSSKNRGSVSPTYSTTASPSSPKGSSYHR